jgi:hypothetical protein
MIGEREGLGVRAPTADASARATVHRATRVGDGRTVSETPRVR